VARVGGLRDGKEVIVGDGILHRDQRESHIGKIGGGNAPRASERRDKGTPGNLDAAVVSLQRSEMVRFKTVLRVIETIVRVWRATSPADRRHTRSTFKVAHAKDRS
jgi:hypothetical protein